MTARRRNVVESSDTRALLLDTAELIMKEEGYPAVTTRRLASRMGVSNQLVHYYFRTMDELFVSLMRRGVERSVARLAQALAAKNPLQALMALYGNTDAAKLQIEYLALINHRKDLPAEATRHTEHIRSLEAEALAGILNYSALDSAQYPPKGIAVLLSAIGRIIAIEKTVGISLGHTEATGIMDRLIASLGRTHSSKVKETRDAAPDTVRTQRSGRKKSR
jgi:AcrR family transcriptional regulator